MFLLPLLLLGPGRVAAPPPGRYASLTAEGQRLMQMHAAGLPVVPGGLRTWLRAGSLLTPKRHAPTPLPTPLPTPSPTPVQAPVPVYADALRLHIRFRVVLQLPVGAFNQILQRDFGSAIAAALRLPASTVYIWSVARTGTHTNPATSAVYELAVHQSLCESTKSRIESVACEVNAVGQLQAQLEGDEFHDAVDARIIKNMGLFAIAHMSRASGWRVAAVSDMASEQEAEIPTAAAPTRPGVRVRYAQGNDGVCKMSLGKREVCEGMGGCCDGVDCSPCPSDEVRRRSPTGSGKGDAHLDDSAIHINADADRADSSDAVPSSQRAVEWGDSGTLSTRVAHGGGESSGGLHVVHLYSFPRTFLRGAKQGRWQVQLLQRYAFDGVTRLQLPATVVRMDARNCFSISAWLRTSQSGVIFAEVLDATMLERPARVGGRQRILSLDEKGRFVFSVGARGTAAVVGRTSLTDGRWHFVLMAYNCFKRTIQTFVDGLHDGSGHVHMGPDPLFGFQIGAANFDHYFTGLLRDMTYRNFRVDRLEQQKLYRAGHTHGGDIAATHRRQLWRQQQRQQPRLTPRTRAPTPLPTAKSISSPPIQIHTQFPTPPTPRLTAAVLMDFVVTKPPTLAASKCSQTTSYRDLWGAKRCSLWVKQQPSRCKASNYEKYCAKSCHPVMTDAWGTHKCAAWVARARSGAAQFDLCASPNYKRKCALTCHGCTYRSVASRQTSKWSRI